MAEHYTKWIDELLAEISEDTLRSFVKEGEDVVLEIDSRSVVLSKKEGVITAKDLKSPSGEYVLFPK
ncbi:MAG: hypothetical protein ACTSUB_00420 [Candidatus Thorarchaeota archaeon]